MILYATALSSYCAKVRVVLGVKRVAFDEVAPPGGYRSDEYRAIVPMGTLPAIRIGDFVLSESEAINEYLEECHPEPAMLPHDLQLRARVRFLCRFHDLYLEPAVRTLFVHLDPAKRDGALVAVARANIARRFGQLAQWVEPRPWLLTESISLADCGPLVNLPLASAILQACGQPITLPPVLHAWLAMADSDGVVQQALHTHRQAVRQWLGNTTLQRVTTFGA